MGTHSNRANMDEKTYRELGVAPKTLPRRLTRQLYRDFGVSLDFAEGSFGNLVSAIRFDHRRGPMVRATAWLRRVRDSAQLRGTRGHA